MPCVLPKTRIADLNNGQLRLLLRFCEMKAPALTNKTVLDAYKKLLKKATAETDKRHEEEARQPNSLLIEPRVMIPAHIAKADISCSAIMSTNLCIVRRNIEQTTADVGL